METCRERSVVDNSAAICSGTQPTSSLIAVLSLCLFSAIVLYCFRAHVGLLSWEYGDETAYFVAVKMMAKGYHLYKDLFMHHGPLPFMITQLYTVVFDRRDFNYIRVVPIVIMLLSAAAVVFSPALKTWLARVCALTLYLSLLSAVWLPAMLNMLIYPSLGGYWCVILLAQCTVPLYFHERISPWSYFLGGASLALAGFSALQFFLSNALFILAALVVAPKGSVTPIKSLLAFASAMVAVSVGVSAWLLLFGDLPGYFIDHFYFNLVVYSKFADLSPFAVLKNLTVSFTPQLGIHAATLGLMSVWIFYFLWSRQTVRLGRSPRCNAAALALIASGIFFTNPNPDFFYHDDPFLIANFALFALMTGLYKQASISISERRALIRIAVLAVAAILALEVTGSRAGNVFSSAGEAEFAARLKPLSTGIYQFVRSVTREDGDLLALEYNPIVYIRADRNPMSGAFFYFPWQAAYNRKPFKGYEFDMCSDIQHKRPAVIWFFNWRVWNKYSIEMYEPCVLPLITRDYMPIGFNSPWYVRNDVLVRYSGSLPNDPDAEELTRATLQRSGENKKGSIKIIMTPEHEKRPAQLHRIGILFASRLPQGDARLVLRATDGSTFSVAFRLSSVVPNRYRYFDLYPNVYRAGEIIEASSGDVRLWEGSLDQASTCIIYEYADSSRAYTPSCPILDPFGGVSAESSLFSSR